MSANSKIEWTDHTFNPWIGCTKVSPACDNCYAERSTPARTLGVAWGPTAPRHRTSPGNWAMPRRWNAQHEAFFNQHGRRQRVFCASLADVFDNAVDPQWLTDLFELILRTPNLDWLLLTKRIGNWKNRMQAVQDHLSERWSHIAKPRSVSDEESDLMNWVDAWIRNDVDPIPANVWLGATVVNQEEADRDIPKLLAVPAAKRFLSMEPLLGPVDLTDISDGHADRTIPRGYWNEGFDTDDNPPAVGHNALTGKRWQRFGEWHEHGKRLDWVIVGGESGPSARPMHPDWSRSLRDQCAAAGVPFLFKQWGAWLPGQNEVHPYGRGRKVAHHQDGRWGPTTTKIDARNYVTWDASGTLHCGNLWDLDPIPTLHAWAECVGKKAAGRLLDGRTWDGVPT